MRGFSMAQPVVAPLEDTFAREEPVVDGKYPVRGGAERLDWAVGPLMRAIADTLATRFNPVGVRGELSGFSRAARGHCYFSL